MEIKESLLHFYEEKLVLKLPYFTPKWSAWATFSHFLKKSSSEKALKSHKNTILGTFSS